MNSRYSNADIPGAIGFVGVVGEGFNSAVALGTLGSETHIVARFTFFVHTLLSESLRSDALLCSAHILALSAESLSAFTSSVPLRRAAV